MALQELLWFVFFDELIGALIVPMNNKYVLHSTLLLRNDVNYYLAFLSAYLGGVIGVVVNYYFARICSKGLELKFNIHKKTTLVILASLILLPVSYFGGVISCLAGIARLPALRVFKIAASVYILYLVVNLITFTNLQKLFLF